MKALYLLLIIIPSLGIVERKARRNIEVKNHYQQDSLAWAQQFIEFRNAITTNDISKVKSFFDFPVMSDHNEIWQLIYQGNEKEMNKLSENITPFTERDLEKYFLKLFPQRFRQTILTIKTSELKKKGESESTQFKAGNFTTYKMYASVDNDSQTLILSLGFRTIIKDKKGEIESNEEYGTQYVFSILKNGRLKFKEIRTSA